MVTAWPVDVDAGNSYDGGTLPPGVYDAVLAERASGVGGSWRETFVVDGTNRFTRIRQIQATADGGLGPITYRSGTYTLSGGSIQLAYDCARSDATDIDAGPDTLPALISAIDLCRVMQLLVAVESESNGSAKGKAGASALPRETLVLSAICGVEASDGLAGDLRRLLWVATQVRERFSLDNWHAINRLQHQLQQYCAAVRENANPELGEALAFLDQVLLASSSLAGFAMDNMTRDDGWRFLIIGRRIERLVFLANAVSGFLRLESTRASGSLEWLLELTDSIITYRSRYMIQPQVLPTLDLIVFDEGNPHSVAFQLQILVRYLDNLARLLGGPRDEALRQALSRLQGFDLGRFESQSFRECRICDPCIALASLLGEISIAAATLSDRLAMRYFSHVGDVSRQTFAS